MTGKVPGGFRTGIAFRINLILLLILLMLGAVLGGYFALEEKRVLSSEMDKRIAQLGEFLSRSIGHAAAAGDAGAVNRMLQDATPDREIAYIIVKTDEGEILAARWDRDTRGSVREYAFPLRDIAPAGRRSSDAESFGEASASGGKPVAGHLSIGVDLSPRDSRIAALVRNTVLAVALAVALTTILGFQFVRLLLRRSVTPLLSGIRQFGAGDLSHRIENVRIDEIGEIAGAFNEMADTLSTTLVTKRELEEIVARRTGEIRQALDERIRAQTVLAEREERIRLLLESTAEAIYGLDSRGACTFCNPAFVRMFGYGSAEELVGKDMHSLIHHTRPDGSPYPVEECPVHGVMRDQKGYHGKSEVMWKADGGRIDVEYWAYPVFRAGSVVGTVVTAMDISERVRLQGQLAQSQKLEGIGILAGGIAHDFNNILTPILGYTEMALRDLEKTHPARRSLATVLESARRGADLTRQILAFSRKQILELKVMNLNDSVLSFGKMLERLIGEDIRVRLDLAAELPCVKADAAQVQQVLFNLAVNARDAMPKGGELTIQTSTVEIGEKDLWPKSELLPGRYVLLSVADTGEGMDKETLSRIFEPFFTTKGVGKGTGLGLSTVYGIVKQHGGEVRVYSEPGRGTTFRVYLPRIDEAPEREPVPEPVPVRGSGRILLVEDEQPVRELAQIILSDHGYTVTSAAGGTEALEAARRSRYDLLLSDIVMPGMNGPEIYRRILEIQPAIKVLYISGYPIGSGSLRGLLEGGEPLLHKPFTIAAFTEKVRDILGASV